MRKRIFIFSLVVVIIMSFGCISNAQVQGPNLRDGKSYLVMYTKEDVNFRKYPSPMESNVIQVLPKGTAVTVVKKGDRWHSVIYKGKGGFVRNIYLSRAKIEPDPPKPVVEEKPSTQTEIIYTAKTFKNRGVIWWNGWRWTWYSQRVLPGKGLKIPGRHVNENGYVVDANGRICLASSKLKKGTIVSTPFGAEGCVYDSGCASNTLDVYVSW